MGNIDYEQKKKECWLQFCREKGIDKEVNISIYEAFDSIFDCAYALGKQKEEVTQEEIEKAANEFADREYEIGEVDWDALHKGYYHGMKEALGKQVKDAEETVISGWMARNMNGSLYLYRYKPKRNFMQCRWEEKIMDVSTTDDMFPDLTWGDVPQEIELIIKRKNNGNIQ